MTGHQRKDDLLSDYCDGSDFHHYKLYAVNPHYLQLNIYYDDVEVCNPLGSKSKKHKLGNNYLQLHDIILYLSYM